MPDTIDDIRRKGLAALRRTLGTAGMIRFLQQFDGGSGDYATERHLWVDRMSMRDLKKRSAARRARTRRKRA